MDFLVLVTLGAPCSIWEYLLCIFLLIGIEAFIRVYEPVLNHRNENAISVRHIIIINSTRFSALYASLPSCSLLLGVYITCHFGQNVFQGFNQSRDEIYEVSWYKLPVNMQKNWTFQAISDCFRLYSTNSIVISDCTDRPLIRDVRRLNFRSSNAWFKGSYSNSKRFSDIFMPKNHEWQ